MEWTDTLMLEPAPAVSLSESGTAMEFTRVVPLEGVTLLCAEVTSRDQTAAALKLLRGFRATGRRVVLCDTSQLIVGRQFGQEVVDCGSTNMLVTCGLSGREVGIGARDAGLDLSSVVVCDGVISGGQVLASRLVPGDTVLLLGIERQICDEVCSLIARRLGFKPAAAA